MQVDDIKQCISVANAISKMSPVTSLECTAAIQDIVRHYTVKDELSIFYELCGMISHCEDLQSIRKFLVYAAKNGPTVKG